MPELIDTIVLINSDSLIAGDAVGVQLAAGTGLEVDGTISRYQKLLQVSTLQLKMLMLKSKLWCSSK